MTDFKRIVDALRDAGVKEVILETTEEGSAYIEFNGRFDGKEFHTQASNADFSAHDL